MEGIELNWLCKHTKKVRSSQEVVFCIELSKAQFFRVSINKVKKRKLVLQLSLLNMPEYA